MQFLIGYDITEPKRLQRVHKQMVKFAMPIQYSVFLFEGTLTQLLNELKVILALIHKKEDDLRVYPLPTNGKKWRLGKSVMPEGIVFTMLPTALSDN